MTKSGSLQVTDSHLRETMHTFKKGWFSELGKLWPGQAQSLEVDAELASFRSKYQDVVVFKSRAYGKVMVLDGVVQLTERDEFAYHEMIAHLPLFSHKNPQKVLVVGGGDGGTAREIAKHKCVESITLCDIDEEVSTTSKTYFPGVALGLSDRRVELVAADGAQFLLDKESCYDVIITDSSDPVGPAEVLYSRPFYESLFKALAPGGIVCCQAESMWLHADIIVEMVKLCRMVGFSSVEYAYTLVPTYPSGNIGFVLASRGGPCNKAIREISSDISSSLKYYSSDMHRAAFVLPEFFRRQLHKSS